MRQEKPLVKVNVPYVFQLSYQDEKAREAVKLVLDRYKGTSVALSTFNVEEQGPVRGSNIYARNALVNIYREITKENVRPINPRESEIALANDALVDPRGTYEDLGITVYSKEGSNPKLWKNLREQVKSNFQKVNLRKPFVVTGLMNVVKDDNYENKLRLDLSELTEVYNVPVLAQADGRDLNFDTNDPQLQKTGFPSKLLGKGDRTLYTAKDGVQRFDRFRNLNLNAGNGYLAVSSDNGRVHFVKNFSSGNLEELVAKLEQEKSKEQEALDKRFEKAKKVLLNQ